MSKNTNNSPSFSPTTPSYSPLNSSPQYSPTIPSYSPSLNPNDEEKLVKENRDNIKKKMEEMKNMGMEEQIGEKGEENDVPTFVKGSIDKEKEKNILEEIEEELELPIENKSAKEFKEIGNSLFRKGSTSSKKSEIQEAVKNYQFAVVAFKRDGCVDTNLHTVLFSNLSASYILLKNYEKSIKCSSKALEISPKHAKSLYRRAMAYEKLDKLIEAYGDLAILIKEYPNHKLGNIAYLRIAPVAKERQKAQLGKMWNDLKKVGTDLLGKFGINLGNINFKKNDDGGFNVGFNSGEKKDSK